MKRLIWLFFAFFVALQATQGQQSVIPDRSYRESLWKREMKLYATLLEAIQEPISEPNIDVKYYKLDLTITTSPKYLTGVVTMKALSLASNLTAMVLDLTNTMTVDSVRTGSTKLTFVQQPTTLTVTLDRSYSSGEIVTADVYYRGVPVGNGFPSFNFTSHGGIPWVYTCSGPYNARDWWPCKLHLSDKADSVDIWVTADSAFKVGSNGRLVAVINNGNGTRTHRWEERYPITTYNISIAMTNYAEFTTWFKYTPTDSMPVLNYVLPEHLSMAQTSLAKTVEMLQIYSEKFGLYPFVREKYGHAEWDPNLGNLSHQTMSSIGWFDEEFVAHECSHQWFENTVTMASWAHIWMSEGFGTYCTAVYFEAKYGKPSYDAYMAGLMRDAKVAAGSVYNRDTADLSTLCDWNRVYAKGATVLHMLRHVLGDSVFFNSFRAYAQDPRLRYGVGTTEDFKQVFESVSGRQLGYFFDEWVYGERFPQFTYSWKAVPDTDGGYLVDITLSQTTGTTNPAFFTMPIDFRLWSGTWDTTVVLYSDKQRQSFRVLSSHLPDSLRLDPDNWLLCATTLTDVADRKELPSEYLLSQNYPNPFNPCTTIRYELPKSSIVRLSVFDMLGREVAMLVNESREVGVHEVKFDGSGLASGVYLYRLEAGDFVQSRKLLLLR